MPSETASRAARSICDLFGTIDSYEIAIAARIDLELYPADFMCASRIGAGWRDVTKGTPPPNEPVLVWSEEVGVRVAMYTLWKLFLSLPGRWTIADVSHWMPLPEGPK